MRFPRPWTALAALLASGQTYGQNPEQTIQRGYFQLRSQAAVFTRIDGVERVGTATQPFVVDTYWTTNANPSAPMAKVRIQSYRNGFEVGRLVGDGISVWTYDVRRNEYGSAPYGTHRRVQPETYFSTLYQIMNSAARGSGAYSVRLIREVYAGEAALYRSWVPGYRPTEVGGVVTYQYGNPVQRIVRFTVDPQDNSLDSIYFYDRTRQGGQDREVEWTMTIYGYTLVPSEWTFAFVPPAGSRAVAGPRAITFG